MGLIRRPLDRRAKSRGANPSEHGTWKCATCVAQRAAKSSTSGQEYHTSPFAFGFVRARRKNIKNNTLSIPGTPKAAKSGPKAAKSCRERPKSAQERRTAAQVRPRVPQERPKSGQERPKSGQEQPKRGPTAVKSPQNGSREAKGTSRAAKSTLCTWSLWTDLGTWNPGPWTWDLGVGLGMGSKSEGFLARWSHSLWLHSRELLASATWICRIVWVLDFVPGSGS